MPFQADKIINFGTGDIPVQKKDPEEDGVIVTGGPHGDIPGKQYIDAFGTEYIIGPVPGTGGSQEVAQRDPDKDNEGEGDYTTDVEDAE